MFGKKMGFAKDKRPFTRHLYDRFVHKYHAHDLNFELQLLARRESAEYVRAHMVSAVMFQGRWPLLEAAVREAPASGLVLEFGVEKGASANFLARLLTEGGQGRRVDAFDSFEGLPSEWSGTFEKRGKFSRGGSLPEVLPNVRLHKGWFDQTIPAFAAAHAEPIAFLHVDCDLYVSTRSVLDGIGDRLRPGSIVAFDEYFNYHNWREHEFKAWHEFVDRTGIRYEYRGFAARGGQVYVKIL